MSLADYAARQSLHRVGARPGFWRYLKQTWERRDFAITMARFRLAAGQEENRLGVLWLVIRPALNALIYGLIFGVLQGDKRPPDYPAYVAVGVFLFEFFSTSLNMGAKSITGNRALVQSLAFPRLTLPISVVLQQLFALMPMLLVLAAALIGFGHLPTWKWLLMAPLIALYALFNAGVAMIAARLTVHVRDLTQLLPFVNRILFYTSGVLFAVDRILEKYPWAVEAYDFHPIYQVLQLARGLLMDQGTARPEYWFYLSLWAVLTFVAGLLFFWVAEESYGRD